ncbi:hypothetical protein J6590_086797 [Homalodisca vitripennis]|nr:hypothetical protein J6590_086797 [Homalodisca vitripennis]
MSGIVSKYPWRRKVETPPLLRIWSLDLAAISRMYRPRELVSDEPHSTALGTDHPRKVHNGLIWCEVLGEEGETPAPHPNESVARAVYQDRYLSEVKNLDCRSTRRIRELTAGATVLILLTEKQDVRSSHTGNRL